MPRLTIVEEPPAVVPAPNRADIACFVGLVRHRAGISGTEPVLLSRPGEFIRHFEDERSPLRSAVSSFFAEGGRTCWVVRAGDPWPSGAKRAERLEAIALLVPDDRSLDASTPLDRRTWRGLGHLFGLDDPSFVSLPDLPAAVATDAEPLPPREEPPGKGEAFVECTEAIGSDSGSQVDPLPDPAAPVCDEEGYAAWASAIAAAGRLLRRWRPEVQLVAAIPLPAPGLAVTSRSLASLARLGTAIDASPGGTSSAFIQLVYPWVRVDDGLENPEGALLGLLARNALVRGAFRSAAGLVADRISSVEPAIGNAARQGLLDQVSLFGPGPDGWELLSDVTTSRDPAYRPGGSNRLAAVVLRAARRLGEDSTFASSGPELWAQIRRGLEGLFRELLDLGALRGETPDDAYTVRCDRSTITQDDLDSGRVIASVEYQPTAPVDRISVTLTVSDSVAVASRQGGD